MYDLLCGWKNREHLKYLRNVYCTNHSKDQDT